MPGFMFGFGKWFSYNSFVLIFLSLFPNTVFAQEIEIDLIFDAVVEDVVSHVELSEEDKDPIMVVDCEFTCERPIISCGNWTPPPGSYSKDVRSTRSNADKVCRATADSICKRCGGIGVEIYWYTIYKSARWIVD